jgi:ATP-dependent protease ClpP protease subunit
MSKTERIEPWVVTVNGEAYQLGRGARVSLADTRTIVMACNPTEARNAASDAAFKVGVRNATGNEPAEISISGEIGDPYTQSDARSIQNFFRANRGKPVKMLIDSGGGLAWDGIAMHNAAANHDAPVTAIINSIAGSAATLPAVGAGLTQIHENAQFFVHRAALLAYGNRDAMSEAIDWLDAIDEAIARSYKAKTGRALDAMLQLMKGDGKKDGTMMTAREAVAAKFCNEIIPIKSAGSRASSVFVPDNALPKFVDSVRAARIRLSSTMFQPVVSVVSVERKSPKNDSGPMFDVGDRVQVTEEGMATQKGEIRSAKLGYIYTVLCDNGIVMDDCCEDELTMISGGEQ